MGNLIRSEDRRGGTLEYVYDKLGRIREAKHSGGSVERFAFDPAGNILSANHPAAAKSGRLKTPSNPNLYAGNRLKEHNGTEYTYDGLGNLIYRQLPDGENQYFQYDSENQLVRAEIKKAAGNTEIWEYAYDPFGRRLSKERKDKLAWTSTEPKRIHFVWDGSRLAQEYTYKGTYTYIYTDQDSYEPLAQIFHNNKDGKQYLAYIHTDQIGIPREMTDQFGNLLWYGEYSAWGRLKKDGRVYQNAHQPFRLQNQYYDRETGLHYNLMRYYEPDTGRFVNQDPIGLLGGENLYAFAPNAQMWTDIFGLWGDMNGASATVSAGGYSETYHSSRTGHAEINGLNDFLDNNRLKGKDVHISNITGQFRTSGNKPVGMCTNCRTNIFDILKQGEAKSVSFPETRGNKVLGTIKIESSDFDKVRKELDAVRKLPGSDKTRSDAAWDVLHKYNKFGKC